MAGRSWQSHRGKAGYELHRAATVPLEPPSHRHKCCLLTGSEAGPAEVDMQQDRVMELVPPIAIAARRNLLQLKDMPALLWGFAGATRLPCTTPPC